MAPGRGRRRLLFDAEERLTQQDQGRGSPSRSTLLPRSPPAAAGTAGCGAADVRPAPGRARLPGRQISPASPQPTASLIRCSRGGVRRHDLGVSFPEAPHARSSHCAPPSATSGTQLRRTFLEKGRQTLLAFGRHPDPRDPLCRFVDQRPHRAAAPPPRRSALWQRFGPWDRRPGARPRLAGHWPRDRLGATTSCTKPRRCRLPYRHAFGR